MSVLGLWILASLLGCCIGFVTVQRSARHHDCHRRPHAYQWQIANVQPRDYQPSDYGSYYNPPKLYKSKQDPCPSSFEEGQKLLQVYRLIRVIVLFRLQTKAHSSSLDKLVERLVKLQDQLNKLVYHVDGYEEVAALKQGDHEPDSDMFVHDIGRLLLAIQKALNGLDLDDEDNYYNYPQHRFRQDHRPKGNGCCKAHGELCEELRQLRDQANALTVAHVKKEMLYGAKLQAKESDSFDFNIYEQYLPEPYNYEEAQLPQSYQFDELDELVIGLELLLQQQMMIAKAMQFDDQTQVVPAPVIEDVIIPTTTTLATPVIPPAANEPWLGSFFSKGNLLPGHQKVNPAKKENGDLDEQKRQEEAEDIAEDATEGAEEEARELPEGQEELQPAQENADGPSRLDLLADLVDQKEAKATTQPMSIKSRHNYL
ncbi:uncharacterized protein LOC110678578 isoform X2 [Aedes aegypti]|uniref:Uncharacterized protein n=1 Tax=Aedes aegypti TaxID=7159 RepID=A0A6I8TVU1_AEDAE|nr:uncharacterized protein LOC110678578 isoform X2 [Aedes aegypti]